LNRTVSFSEIRVHFNFKDTTLSYWIYALKLKAKHSNQYDLVHILDI